MTCVEVYKPHNNINYSLTKLIVLLNAQNCYRQTFPLNMYMPIINSKIKNNTDKFIYIYIKNLERKNNIEVSSQETNFLNS